VAAAAGIEGFTRTLGNVVVDDGCPVRIIHNWRWGQGSMRNRIETRGPGDMRVAVY
jgi:hypothetical protein